MPHARGGIRAKRLTPDFEQNRDIYHARQLADIGTTEAERRAAFKAKRKGQNGSQMVKRQRPAPTLKPSPKMARGADRTAHQDQLARDAKDARRNAKIARGEAMLSELKQHDQWLDATTRRVTEKSVGATAEQIRADQRAIFKAKRQMGVRTERILSHARAVHLDIRD